MKNITKLNFPVFKSVTRENYLFFTESNNWKVGDDYNIDSGGVSSPYGEYLPRMLTLPWYYYNNNSWHEDPSIKVQSLQDIEDPEEISITSEGGALQKQNSKLGLFRKLENVTRNNLPVYKSER